MVFNGSKYIQDLTMIIITIIIIIIIITMVTKLVSGHQ